MNCFRKEKIKKNILPLISTLTKELENKGVQTLLHLWLDYNDLDKSDKKQINKIINELVKFKDDNP